MFVEYVYPAIFHRNMDESYTIIYPDLPGCISEGKNLGNATTASCPHRALRLLKHPRVIVW